MMNDYGHKITVAHLYLENICKYDMPSVGEDAAPQQPLLLVFVGGETCSFQARELLFLT